MRIVALISSACIALTVSCGVGPSSKKLNNALGQNDSASSDDAVADDSGAGSKDSLSAFSSTVYPVLRNNTCKGCHESSVAPYIAAADPAEAHQQILDSNKVDLNNPDKSRLYLRLAEDKHNCWSSDCAADAASMLSAITAWKDQMADVSADGGAVSFTEGQTFADALTKAQPFDQRTILLEGEGGTIAAPFRSTVIAGSSGGRLLDSPARTNNPTLLANDATAGRVTYTVTVAEDGMYRIWGNVAAPAAATNSFFVQVDADAPRAWIFPVAATLSWNLASDAVTAGNIHQFALTAGQHTITVRERQARARLDRIVLTSDQGVSSTLLANPVNPRYLSFDLSAIVNAPNVKFEIEIAKFDDFSFIFRNPTIVTAGKRIHVEGIHVLLNGVASPQATTYASVNATAGPPGLRVSNAALVLPFDRGIDEDEITIGFDKIEIAN